jgi:hypothetical protein
MSILFFLSFDNGVHVIVSGLEILNFEKNSNSEKIFILA